MHKRTHITRFVSLMMFFTLFFSCKNGVNDKKDNSLVVYSTEQMDIDFYREDCSNFEREDGSKLYKIDSSSFEIWASETSLWVSFEEKASFKSQIYKMESILEQIQKEMNISKFKQIIIYSLNDELIADIASVTEIQEELKKSEIENRLVNSMGVVSQFANNSKYLKYFTNLLSKYNLNSYDIYIDKCYSMETLGDSSIYSMNCSTIRFKLKNNK